MWAFKPTNVIDIRYLPDQERLDIERTLAKLRHKGRTAKPFVSGSDGALRESIRFPLRHWPSQLPRESREFIHNLDQPCSPLLVRRDLDSIVSRTLLIGIIQISNLRDFGSQRENALVDRLRIHWQDYRREEEVSLLIVHRRRRRRGLMATRDAEIDQCHEHQRGCHIDKDATSCGGLPGNHVSRLFLG